MHETESELRRELKQARADLLQTSSEIKRRLTVDELHLEHQVKRNPAASILLSAGLGFMIGRASRHTAALLALLTGVAVGYSLARRESQPDRQVE
ncbi:MAG TPA: hypothetical protein VNE82_00435 [Candidatus Binataceae bacterium]|nr:hypothetical protein [Candidatus Binataceae bacterium]